MKEDELYKYHAGEEERAHQQMGMGEEEGQNDNASDE